MKTLYIVRHAESEANEQNILASRMDFVLSSSGKHQAAVIADAFCADHRLELVVSSPLTRARQTAQAFIKAAGGPPLEIRDEITEVHLGRYSGMSYADLESAVGYVHDRGARWEWVPQGGGESYSMIADRVRPFFDWIDRREEGHILVVSHAVTMRLLRAHLENTLPEYPLSIARNGEVWKVPYRGFGRTHEIESLVFEDAVPDRRA